MHQLMPNDKDEAQAHMKAVAPKPGHYRHYKGGEYEVITCAVKEDTLQPLVIYRSLLKDSMWARTFKNWNEAIEVDGKRVRRFEPIES